ncbi:MAG TPA: low molecular weight protein-tyrosine-phosphatase [Burkholderiales bacterium]|nr:low molecular weight protein-tyrosine-phosphatase [Burkholderiales bacterium]
MASKAATVSVLFVCMGNICRSPTAEGIFLRRVAEAGLGDRITVDSAGTHSYHVGRPPDPRSRAAAAVRGYELDELRARLVTPEDFARFDHILAMDSDNLADLKLIAPPGLESKARLLMDYASKWIGLEVPDPYAGGPDGFVRVLDMIENACDGLLDQVKKELGVAPSSS